ncbi:hypothetical protein HZB96_00355 [Candidatus Gottesmanbacteria bacterium]|nr:hypothetical protein [Candidatus Gottesmanbacteria bacterium]MBI5452759.1 hypothetical protein [Candidatus Gottesmanbacteria bacterium]
MPAKIETAAVETICYSDIFDYPLTEEEIWKWLIKIKNQKSKIKNTIKNLKLIEKKDNYYFFCGRDKIINLRKERKKYSQQKLKIASKVINIIKIIPSVKLIGITGALAVDNAKKSDDIDLLIISSKDLLWTTRLLITLLIEITGMRRHPGESNVNNKICLNMFVDENYLEIPKKEQDLFSAHEVAQMKLIWDRDDTYYKFLKANDWVRRYLPNAYQKLVMGKSGKDTSDGGEASTSTPPRWRKQEPPMVEELAKRFQLWYMRNRRTKEVIKEGIIRFHPQDAREWVMKEYRRRISNLMSLSHRISIEESV